MLAIAIGCGAITSGWKNGAGLSLTNGGGDGILTPTMITSSIRLR
jgi:hypothetical protein